MSFADALRVGSGGGAAHASGGRRGKAGPYRAAPTGGDGGGGKIDAPLRTDRATVVTAPLGNESRSRWSTSSVRGSLRGASTASSPSLSPSPELPVLEDAVLKVEADADRDTEDVAAPLELNSAKESSPDADEAEAEAVDAEPDVLERVPSVADTDNRHLSSSSRLPLRSFLPQLPLRDADGELTDMRAFTVNGKKVVVITL